VVKLVWLVQVGVAQAVRQEGNPPVALMGPIHAPAIGPIPRLVAVQHTRGTDDDGTATSQADNDCHFRRWPDSATHDPPHWRLYSDAAARLHPDDHAWQFRVEVWRRLLPAPWQSLCGGEVLTPF
jgi:hypothetical protein